MTVDPTAQRGARERKRGLATRVLERTPRVLLGFRRLCAALLRKSREQSTPATGAWCYDFPRAVADLRNGSELRDGVGLPGSAAP